MLEPICNYHNDIAQLINANDLISHSDHLRTYLNDTARRSQTMQLEEKIINLNQHFQNTSNAVRARYLQEFQHGIDLLKQEQQKVNIIQDPPSMRCRRTYGRGGKRLPTGAEIVDKELQDQQKSAEREARRQ
jgi:histidine ammonia-lyase